MLYRAYVRWQNQVSALPRVSRTRVRAPDPPPFAQWKYTLERALPAIVVIRANYVRPFDGDHAGAGHATGFVVDAKRGLILTNRHVVSTGPVRAEATFLNKEEVRAPRKRARVSELSD